MRLPLLFLAAVLVPCGVLGWLGWRSIGDERALAARQQAALCQNAADNAARAARDAVDSAVASFAAAVGDLWRATGPESVAQFPGDLAARWPLAESGTVLELTPSGFRPPDSAPPEAGVLLRRHPELFDVPEAPAIARFGRAGSEAQKPVPDEDRGNQFADASRLSASRPASRSLVAAEAAGALEKSEGPPVATIDQADAAAEPRAAPETAAAAPAAPATRRQTRADAPAAPPPEGEGAGLVATRESASVPMQEAAEAEEPKKPAEPPPARDVGAFRLTEETKSDDSAAGKDAHVSPTTALGDASPKSSPAGGSSADSRRKPADSLSLARVVRPQHIPPDIAERGALPSSLPAQPPSLRQLVESARSGAAGRLDADGRAVTAFWHRPSDDSPVVFVAIPDPAALRSAVAGALGHPDAGMFVALLDESGAPVARAAGPGVSEDFEPPSWREPFAASEAGGALPLWEAAVWLADPGAVEAAGRAAGRRLALIVCVALTAAAAGAWLLFRDHRRTALDARRKSDFVSNVSHELRTPLTSIRMFSDLLRADPAPPPAKSSQYAGIIGDEAGRLTRLIDNLLDFSRLEHRRQPLHLADGDLRTAVDEAVSRCRPQLAGAGFALRLELPEAEVPARFDRDAVVRIVTNLLSNAAKYGHPPERSGRVPEVTVRLETAESGAALAISDNGPGIPRGHEKRVFRRFERGDRSPAAGVPGSGLGLTLARDLARAMGGDLRYRPAAGPAPHAFVVFLPAAGPR